MKINKALILILLAVLAISPNCQSSGSVPNELIGTWTSDAQEYSGIFFKLNQNTILIGKKDGTVDTFSLIKTKRKKMKGDWVKYIIIYKSHQSKKYEFSILYNSHNNGIVRFVNKEQKTWTRKSS